MNDENLKFLGTIREQYGRICWTHKTHEKAREIATRKTGKIKIGGVVLTFLTLTSIFATIKYPSNEIWFWTATIIGSISFAFQVFSLAFQPEKSESDHRNAAKTLLRLREGYLIIITRLMAGELLETVKPDYYKISEQLVDIYPYLPDSDSEAYDAASHALKSSEDLTFSDQEIDHLLPASLRISKA